MAQFALFVLSYTPLFFLIIVKQVSVNFEYMHWVGISFESIRLFFEKFGLSVTLSLLVSIGVIGSIFLFQNLKSVADNGVPIAVTDVKNKNSESIGYIATYIIPFLFQDFSNWYQCFSILFLIFIIYRIYINSSLILINPLLSYWYSIYEIEYSYNGKSKNGLIITSNKYLKEDEHIKIYEIGHKLYYSIPNN